MSTKEKEYKLFLNRNLGVDFCLDKALKEQGITHKYITFKEEPKVCEEHKIRLTPVLLILQDGVEIERIFGVEDILDVLAPKRDKKKEKKEKKKEEAANESE